MTNIWNSIFHNVFGVSYVRLPLMLSIPLVYKYTMDPSVDRLFNWYNEGANQKAIWERLEKKAAESGGAAEDPEEEELAEDA